ncbi:F-box associated domain containing protein [Tanacetum coccineum]
MDKSRPLTRNQLLIRINEPLNTPNSYSGVPVLPLREAYGDPRIEIVGSCNGLLCIVEHSTLIIYNPNTRKLNKLPSSGLIKQERFVLEYAFGYDESTDDYKVVGLSFSRPTPYTSSDTDLKVKIYSLKTGKWKMINDFPDVLPTWKRGKVLNGALHWGVFKDKNSRSPWSTILSLDLAKETYSEISQPMYEEGHSSLTLGVLGEWLCVVVGYSFKRVDVWVMKDYGVKDSWTRLLSIPHVRGHGKYRVPLCISNTGKVLLQLNTKLAVYDSTSDSFTDIHNFKRFYQACTIVESLVSPHAPLMQNN